MSYPPNMGRKKDAFAPGTQVGVRFSGQIVPAFIIEDRGVVTSGRRIVRVHLGDWNDPEALEFETATDDLEPLPAAA